MMLDVSKMSEREMRREIRALRVALQDLAWQHGWHGDMGKCVCLAHVQVEELGLRYDVPATKGKRRSVVT